MQLVSAREAVRRIPDGSRVILPHGAIEPIAFYEALAAECEGFRHLTLYSGLQFGDYRYLDRGLGTTFSYVTWQASAKIRQQMREGHVEVLPLRFRDVVRVVSASGAVRPDVVVIQIAKPDQGRANLGISVSLYRDLVANASLVIAEINERMPLTCGDTQIDLDDIDLAIESDAPLGEYRPSRRSPRDEAIVQRVLGLIPPGAWVQIGVGAIPDAVLCHLHEIPDARIHSGMLTDGLIDYVRGNPKRAEVVTGEVAGSPELYDFVRRESRVQFHTSRITHDLASIARRPGFVSVNSAIEVDLHGQVNGETIDGLQVSGVGGSLDFVDGAAASEGGRAILALPSTTEDGKRSKIVRRLAAQTPATIPRYSVDIVVTEHGVAELRGRTLRQRAEALLAIAHPAFRDELRASAV